MQFLYPNFLWALLALAIPILIHLFYFRRFKKIKFTNVKFLKEIKEETASRNRLKNLLILFTRCLTLVALILAFAQPYLSDDDHIKKGVNTISIFVDNSESMKAEHENIPLFEIAKSRARSIIETYQSNDEFQVLTHQFKAIHQRLVSKEEAIALIDDIEVTPQVKKLSQVLNRQKQLLDGENNIIYILSDFQNSITDISNEIDSIYEVNLLPIQTTIEKNVSIDTVYFESPVPILNQTNILWVEITNHSNDPVERLKISLDKDGQVKPIGVIDIPGNSTVTESVPLSILSPGFHEGKIKITDYPVQFDDEFFFSFQVPDRIKILIINEINANKYLNALFGGIEYFELENQYLNQIQFQSFNEYNLILLNDISEISSGLSNELKQYIESGGKVLIFPSINANLSSFNSFFSSVKAPSFGLLNKKELSVSKINMDDFVFADVFENIKSNIKLPVTLQNYLFNQTQRSNCQTLLTYQNNNPYLLKSKVDKGYLYQCASPLNSNYNDMVLNAEIFVPMLYKMALATAYPSKLAYWIGQENLIQLSKQNNQVEQVYTIKGKSEFIPGMTNYGKSVILDLKDQIKAAGFYKLTFGDNQIKSLAFNYDRKESDLKVFTEAQLNELLKNSNINILKNYDDLQLAAVIQQKDKGILLWKWLLWASLLFLLLEILFIRLLKN
jgi:hypothetical protein